MTALPAPLDDSEIAARLEALPGWIRDGDEITRTFAHTYHECAHLAVYVAAKAREVSHHPDMLITWQRIEFRITTRDAGRKLTELGFGLARDMTGSRKLLAQPRQMRRPGTEGGHRQQCRHPTGPSSGMGSRSTRAGRRGDRPMP